MRIEFSNWRKVGTTQLYQLALGTMAFFYGLKQIYIFSSSSLIEICNDVVQLVAYFILIYLILHRSFKSKWMKYAFMAIVVIFIGMEQSNSTSWLRYFLLIIAARDISYKKIMRTLASVYMCVFALSCILYMFGISDSGIARRAAISLGFSHPNGASLMLIVIIFLFLCSKNSITYQRVLIVYGMAALIGTVLKTRVAVVCLLISPILYVIIKHGCENNKKIIKFFSCGSQLIVFLISVLLVVLYPLRIYDPFRSALDILFMYRPYLNFNNIMRYGVSLWGQNVTLYNTNEYVYNYYGGFVTNQKFNTVDNAYIAGLITIGIIPMIMLFICFIAVTNKAWVNKNYTILTISVCFSMYAFIESACNEAFYMFPYFYLLAFDDINFDKENSA